MNNNTFGRLFSVVTFGESHGPAVGCIIDGCPAGVPLAESDIQPMLDRRRPGRRPEVSIRREDDQVRILSGVFEGATTGHPICLLMENRDQRPDDYETLRHIFRPGHADATHEVKYGIRDHRGGGRSSARETAARVAAGAVARRMLMESQTCNRIRVTAGLVRLGNVMADVSRWRDDAIDSNPFFCPDPDAAKAMARELEDAAGKGDSLGGIVEARAAGVPPGLGEPAHDRLDARIAQACMGVNAVKGVEIGDGFMAAAARGSGNNDPMRSPASGAFADAFLANHAGGVLGGISTGQTIVVRAAVKPTPSIRLPQQTVNASLENVDVEVGGRHDPAVAIRAVPVVGAMLWLTLADFALLNMTRRIRKQGGGL
ncbi:MAG: chorismate synthase [Planctomycetota bacterium]|jgi:chorismate synthase|nr:chorismate synthase [Planctomycetota bacterium]